MDYKLMALSLVVSTGYVFIKGFQHKNVNTGKIKLIIPTAYIMALMDWAAIALVIKGGWEIAITSGTGAAIGMVAAIKLHDKLFGTDAKI